MKYSLIVVLSFFMLSACSAPEQVAHKTSLATQNEVSIGQSAVAMPDAFSADVAQQIMLDGGNAIDAAIAAQFVLAVTLPEAGNIGL